MFPWLSSTTRKRYPCVYEGNSEKQQCDGATEINCDSPSVLCVRGIRTPRSGSRARLLCSACLPSAAPPANNETTAQS
jgi:hypothetical protein